MTDAADFIIKPENGDIVVVIQKRVWSGLFRPKFVLVKEFKPKGGFVVWTRTEVLAVFPWKWLSLLGLHISMLFAEKSSWAKEIYLAVYQLQLNRREL